MGLLNKALPIEAGVTKKITSTENDGGLLDRIARYHRANSLFYGIVFETLSGGTAVARGSLAEGSGKQTKNQTKKLFEDISALIGTLGTVVDLHSRRVLALVPHSLDRAVITHRISKSLGAGVVDDFEADSPNAAFERVQDYL
jgi:hypothetical protein